MNLNDNRLIIKTLKSGDQKVFSLVYASYYKPLCLFCSSYVSLEEAEEIVQDLMMYVWEKRELLVEDLSLKSFLFTSVRNRALNSITRSHITRQVYEEYQSQQLKSLPALDSCYGTELIKRGNFVIYTSLQDLLDVFEREKFGREKSSESDADVFLDCDFLIIDDLGAEFQSSFSTSCLYHVINSRINRKSPFIISTNLSLKEIESSYDARLSSRIVYETVNIPFPKVDIRLERKKK